MDRTVAVRTAAAGALWALATWGHATLTGTGSFALFLAAAMLGAGWLVAGPQRGRGRLAPGVAARPPTVRTGPDAAADRDALRRLEAELHALEDQLGSAPEPVRV